MLSPRWRRVALSAHIVSSVGWLGAVVVFLGLAVIGLSSASAPTVRGVYLVMEPGAWAVLVPLAFASLVTGLIGSFGTSWGLVRHYWVLIKLGINAVTTLVLLLYMQTFSRLAATAADPTVGLEAVRNPSPLIHASGALALLLVAAGVSVFKPRGLTPYGWRRQQRDRGNRAVATARSLSPP